MTSDPQDFGQQPIKGTEFWHQISKYVATRIVNRLSFSRDGAVHARQCSIAGVKVESEALSTSSIVTSDMYCLEKS